MRFMGCSLPPIQAEKQGRTGHDSDDFLWRGRMSKSAPDTTRVTNLLRAWSHGDEAALDQLAEHVYGELHHMARRFMKNERKENTLQATELVHEVYLRLVDVAEDELAEHVTEGTFDRWPPPDIRGGIRRCRC